MNLPVFKIFRFISDSFFFNVWIKFADIISLKENLSKMTGGLWDQNTNY